jgi:hypothetical protein
MRNRQSGATEKYASQMTDFRRVTLLGTVCPGVSSCYILKGGKLPQEAIRSLILGHSVMYEIRTFDCNVWRQVWPIWDQVLYTPYAHSTDSDSL